ncbi:MAG: hypothetical protein H6Q70_3207 [Firmicutes bacterium]|nr:hypothetical protein [Bacillota bacterium]
MTLIPITFYTLLNVVTFIIVKEIELLHLEYTSDKYSDTIGKIGIV